VERRRRAQRVRRMSRGVRWVGVGSAAAAASASGVDTREGGEEESF